jgi:F-type H+-transporting ATPase subunit c
MKFTLRRAFFAVATTLFCAFPVFAQTPAAAGDGIGTGLKYIGAGVGFAIAAGLCGLGQGRIAAAACEGLARNPGAGGRIQTAMILGLAFVETLVIFTFVVILLKIPSPAQ